MASKKLQKGTSQGGNENLWVENHADEIPYLINGNMHHSFMYTKKKLQLNYYTP